MTREEAIAYGKRVIALGLNDETIEREEYNAQWEEKGE